LDSIYCIYGVLGCNRMRWSICSAKRTKSRFVYSLDLILKSLNVHLTRIENILHGIIDLLHCFYRLNSYNDHFNGCVLLHVLVVGVLASIKSVIWSQVEYIRYLMAESHMECQPVIDLCILYFQIDYIH
jgi:hypothetical protein